MSIHSKVRGRAFATLLALSLPFASMPAAQANAGIYAFAGPKVTPEDAARKRSEAQVTGRQLLTSDPSAAGVHYDTKASEWGDPVLYLDGADAYYAAAEKDGEIPLAEAGIERARIALDLLFFQLDASADKNFRLVDTADIPDLITRANTALKTGEDLIAKLKADADAAVATVEQPKKEKRQRKPINGRALFISGAVFTGIGGAVAALGGVGLVLGAVRQNEAEKQSVYGTEYDAVAARGRNANVLAGVGLGVGGALVLGGVVMMIVGKVAQKKQGKATPDEKPSEKTVAAHTGRRNSVRAGRGDRPRDRMVRFAPTLNGVAISGRF